MQRHITHHLVCCYLGHHWRWNGLGAGPGALRAAIEQARAVVLNTSSVGSHVADHADPSARNLARHRVSVRVSENSLVSGLHEVTLMFHFDRRTDVLYLCLDYARQPHTFSFLPMIAQVVQLFDG